VTHEPEIAEHARRIIQMRDGRIVADLKNESPRWAEEELKELGGGPQPILATVDEEDGDEP
jgi:ABC-type lipoprotein export system ATPase subunit